MWNMIKKKTSSEYLHVFQEHLRYSLESKGAAIQFPGYLKTSLFGWGAADQQELVRRVHELQLLINDNGREVHRV